MKIPDQNRPEQRPLRLEHVTLTLNGKLLIEVDTEVEPGNVVTIMGPSGSGKSTLLAFIAGFLDPAFKASGKVWLGDDCINALPAEHRRTGVLFQDALLFPHMSVGQNLLFALPQSVSGSDWRRNKVEQALVDAELDGFFDRDPATLSGGQRARVALMRILLSEPRALLLDEPFSKLDANLRSQIRNFVFDRATNTGLPVLMVTHDEDDASAADGLIIRV